MPVIDLKDYLGMPQQAPAQPVFQATTQNVDPMALRAADPYSSDAFLANVEARQRLAGLQRLAPVFQAQQAQLAYDQVAEQARQLRQKQEIEAQVQRATEEITQGAIDPESDQFNQQVMGLYTRNPMAFADNRMQQAMSFLGRRADELAQQKRLRAEAEYEMQKNAATAIDKAETRFLVGGGTIDELNRFRQEAKSPDEYVSFVEQGAGKLATSRRAGRGAGVESERIKQLRDAYNFTADDLEQGNLTEAEVPAAEERLQKLRNEIIREQNLSLFPPAAPTVTPPPAGGGAAPAPTTQVQQPPSPTQQIDLDTQLAAIPFAQQREFLERAKIAKAEQEAIAPAWTKAKTEIGDLIKKVVPDKPLPGTKVNELESFARAVLNPNENIIQHPEYGSIPVAWDILNKAGVPMAEIMTNATVFRQPGEGRRLLGFIGTQQVGYQELLRQWAKDFLNERGTLSPSPVAKEIPLNTRSKALENVMKAIETDQTVK
jgi:hypothetical protein